MCAVHLQVDDDEGGASGGKKAGSGTTVKVFEYLLRLTLKVRHILCEKHGKCMEAMEKLKAAYYPQDGAAPAKGIAKWNEVCISAIQTHVKIATAYSEDKARSGVSYVHKALTW